MFARINAVFESNVLKDKKLIWYYFQNNLLKLKIIKIFYFEKNYNQLQNHNFKNVGKQQSVIFFYFQVKI